MLKKQSTEICCNGRYMRDDNKTRYGLHRHHHWLYCPLWTLDFFRNLRQSSLFTATFLQVFASGALLDILDHTTLPSQSGPSNFPSPFRSGIKHLLACPTVLCTYSMSIPAYSVFFCIFSNVACRVVAMQRQRDGRIYQGRFWATAL
jgi:hypothetical protein